MKIGIIGGGASGVFAAIRIKELHPNYDVVIFERSDKLLKKIYATGNGRCNFANSDPIVDAYNNKFAISTVNEFNHEKLDKYFDSIGIKSRKIDSLYYPYSLSAATVAEKLICRVIELDIQVVLNAKIISYTNKKEISVSGKNYKLDKLIFACGGKSSPQLGSDGSIFSILESHNYKIEKLSPSLCPIKVRENVNKLDGVRAKAKVTLFDNGKEVTSELGEVQFRSDSISGIVIFNMAFVINKYNLHNETTTFNVDFVPEIKERISKDDYNSYLNEKLSSYLIKNNLDIHSVKFTFKSLYGFENSQVSSGGVSLDDLSDSLESKHENGVYFIGEMVDVDAKCGGFNLMWAFASAEKVAKSIC
ncbi:MAG: aminoacetone oxidase family FAD-binding enzyme [Bacilli bacterium]|nr:aminoacetone oxidase family FAD-binding enzyme [Bacilli bacterium]